MKNDLIKILKISAISICFSIGVMIGNWLEADVGSYNPHAQTLSKVSNQLDYTNWLRIEYFKTRNIVGQHRLTLEEHEWFVQRIMYYSIVKVDLSPSLLAAVAHVESKFQPGVVSYAGASGILQVMPDIWWDFVVDKCGYWYRGDPEVEICGGAHVLRYYMNLCDNDIECALSYYNSGYPPHRSTAGRRYVSNVLGVFGG